MVLTKTQKVSAIVYQDVDYLVDSEEYSDLKGKGMDDSEILDELVSNDKVEVTYVTDKVVEVIQVHECKVEVV